MNNKWLNKISLRDCRKFKHGGLYKNEKNLIFRGCFPVMVSESRSSFSTTLISSVHHLPLFRLLCSSHLFFFFCKIPSRCVSSFFVFLNTFFSFSLSLLVPFLSSLYISFISIFMSFLFPLHPCSPFAIIFFSCTISYHNYFLTLITSFLASFLPYVPHCFPSLCPIFLL